MTGELAKVKILAFKDKNYNQKVGEFELPINPEQFTQTFKSQYDRQQPAGSSGNDPEYKYTVPETISLNFTIDGTGVIPAKGNAGTSQADVAGQVAELLKVVYVMNSTTHKPNFLELLWGETSFGDQNTFKCILTDLTIDYTLFAPSGKPLRARLKASFTSYIDPQRRIREEGKESPDITHVRTVKAGETLPLMTHRIYGDQSYYLQVAKVNGLVNFRRLRTSTNLRFPPIDKTSL
ncbi:MAG: LysM peptidoglycan-binding domain-containing protein [Synechococcales bacterium]|nr:LysM peptidoglycan-binding domain-containing protein [Synechococcales bacterium]